MGAKVVMVEMIFNPKILVVVCALNEEKNIERCIIDLMESISSADAKSEFKVVISDNSSTDLTGTISKSLCEQYNELSYFKIQHASLSTSRNIYKKRNADYVAYIDADGSVDRDWAKILLRYINTENFDVLSGPVYELDGNRSAIFNMFYDYRWLRTNYIIGANMIFRRDILDEVGGFPDVFSSRGDETTLLLKFRKNGIGIRHIFSEDVIAYNQFPKNLKQFYECLYMDGKTAFKIDKWFNNVSEKVGVLRALRVLLVVFSSVLICWGTSWFVIIFLLLLVCTVYLKNEFGSIRINRDLLFYSPGRALAKFIIDIGYLSEALYVSRQQPISLANQKDPIIIDELPKQNK